MNDASPSLDEEITSWFTSRHPLSSQDTSLVFPCRTASTATCDSSDSDSHVHIEIHRHDDDASTLSSCSSVHRTSHFGFLQEDLIPALSISMQYYITLFDAATTKPSNSKTEIDVPLFHAAIKRRLVGLRILWSDDAYTSEISLPPTIDGLSVVLRVQSVWSNRSKERGVSSKSTGGMKRSCGHYIILPSTRMTLIAKETGGEALKAVDPLPKTLSSPETTPAAAKLLVETMQCIQSNTSVSLARSFLFLGQPGTGKTHSVRMAVEAVGGEACRLVAINGAEIMGSGRGAEAALTLEKHFRRAFQCCQNNSTALALLFLDEFDALASSIPVTAMLAMLLDDVSSDPSWRRILVVAATNRVDSVPSHLRRPGRFDREILFRPPNASERRAMLSDILVETGGHDLFEMGGAELDALAESCVGFVPADLVALVRKAILVRLTNPKTTSKDLLTEARSTVGAYALRDAAITAPPNTDWSDIAGDCGGAKLALQQAIEWPRTRRKAYQHLGLKAPRGVLLYGLPGTGKTLLARAAAGSSGIAFLSLSPADVYSSSYVGDAEAVIRRAFTLARAAAPCVLFFDEIDAIIGVEDNGSHGMSRGHSAEARTLSTFLNEMDGIDGSVDDGVMVLGATNRPWTIDRALLRPGRFDKVIYVPPPDFVGRRSILEMQCRGWKADASLDLDFLASHDITGSMTGAELVGACREVAMNVFNDAIAAGASPCITQDYLVDAFRKVQRLASNVRVLQELRTFQGQQ
jgi:SpoVK/Ycf46/Vps4 family AAA+-type ATPase